MSSVPKQVELAQTCAHLCIFLNSFLYSLFSFSYPVSIDRKKATTRNKQKSSDHVRIAPVKMTEVSA
jgi:hypothetical protein